jgi:hypothetical protein
MKLVYIAGPYTNKNKFEITRNIARANEMAIQVELLGEDLFPVTPHLMTAHHDDAREYEYFLAGTAEVLRRCDYMLVLEGWETSKGTKLEIDLANDLKIPVFYALDQLIYRRVTERLDDLAAEDWEERRCR